MIPASETPSAVDVHEMMRQSNRRVGIGIAVLVLFVSIGMWFSFQSSAASEDSFNATSVQLANSARNACISDRRTDQDKAIGRIVIASNRALVAGAVRDDDTEAFRQVDLLEEAIGDWEIATEALRTEVVDLDPSLGGCGAPILSLKDLDK